MARLLLCLLAFAFLPGCASNEEQTGAGARGEAIVSANCSSCHAIGRSGDSPASQAPPFRTLSQNYPVSDLEEALVEGISVGHPAMPQFAFTSQDAHAVVLYLQTIQDPGETGN
ncbi:MAG: cytochrome c [Terricaulis sp.]